MLGHFQLNPRHDFYMFWGEAFLAKNDYRQEGTLILSSLLEDLDEG